MRKILLLAALFMLAATNVGYGADLTVGVCDLQKVVEQSKALDELYATMQKSIDPIKADLEKERAQLAKEASVLQDPKATKEQRDKFIARQTEYMEKTSAVLANLKDSEMQARLEMDKLVLLAAENYAKKNKFDLIIDTQNMLYPSQVADFKHAKDITADMITEVNNLWAKSKKK